MVHLVVDQGKGFEEGVVDAVAQGDVEGCETDGGIHDHELDGTDKSFEGDFAGIEVCLVNFGLGFEARVAGEFAEALGAAEEEVRGEGFREEEEHGEEDGTAEPEHFPKGPAPVFCGDGEAADEGTEGLCKVLEESLCEGEVEDLPVHKSLRTPRYTGHTAT